MVRTQVQLTEDQAEKLRTMASRLDVSMAEVIRRLVTTAESPRVDGPADRRARAAALAGRFSSGRTDISSRHDKYLDEAWA